MARYLNSLKLEAKLLMEGLGWIRHPKEVKVFRGRRLLITSGALFRKTEKDDVWLYQLGKHHHRVVDIGCNVGQSTLVLMMGANNHILCIDPNSRALSFCAENLIVNGLSAQARFVNCFVSNENDQEIDFYTVGTGAAGSMYAGFARTAFGKKSSYKVVTRTLESICGQVGFEPDLVKIDVEGAESLVLEGMGSYILRSRPKIFVEVHSGAELDIVSNTERIFSWCSRHDYVPFYVSAHAMLVSADVIRNRGRYHLLLLPKEEDYPQYLIGIPENADLESFDHLI